MTIDSEDVIVASAGAATSFSIFFEIIDGFLGLCVAGATLIYLILKISDLVKCEDTEQEKDKNESNTK